MEATIDTSQLQVLEDFFYDLSTVDERKIFLSAFRKAAIPAVVAAKITVPVARGNLWRSIGTKAVPGETALWIGSIRNTIYITKGGKLSKVWYGLLTEEGTERGIEGTHWFSNAWSATKGEVYGTIEQEWYNSIERFIKRTNAKMK